MYSAGIFAGGRSDAHKIPGSNMSTEDFKSRATNCALLTITIICVCILVACGVMIVREYVLGKDYEPTTCTVMNVTYAKALITCMFCATGGKEKSKEKGIGSCIPSHFPCLHIRVRYKIASGEYVYGLLHPDSLQAAGAYAQCSFSVCLEKLEDNRKAVDKYAKDWIEEKDSFKCFYNTMDADNAIVLKMHDEYDVLHSMLWPSIAICICGAIFLYQEVKKRGMDFCLGKPPSTLPGNSKHYDGIESQSSKQTLLQIQPPNHSDSSKVSCKIMPKDSKDYLHDRHFSNSLSSLDRIRDPDIRPQYKSEHKSSLAGKKGKSLDKSGSNNPAAVKNSRSADALKYHQVRHDDKKIEAYRQDSNCSSNGSGKGQETPV